MDGDTPLWTSTKKPTSKENSKILLLWRQQQQQQQQQQHTINMNLNPLLSTILSFIVIQFIWTGEHTDSILNVVSSNLFWVVIIMQSLAYHGRVAVSSSLQCYYTIMTDDNEC